MLPGLFSGMGKGGLSVALFSSTTANAATIAWPASIQAGDVAVLYDLAAGFSQPSSVVPTGFTGIIDILSGAVLVRAMASYKILAGTETGSITGMSGGVVTTKLLYIFRGDAPIAAVTPSTWNGEGTTGDPAPQSVLAGGKPTPLIVIGAGYGSDGSEAFAAAAPAFDAEVGFGTGTICRAGYKIYNSSPVDHTIDVADNNDNILISGYLALA